MGYYINGVELTGREHDIAMDLISDCQVVYIKASAEQGVNANAILRAVVSELALQVVRK